MTITTIGGLLANAGLELCVSVVPRRIGLGEEGTDDDFALE